ncbi:hypothetical protein BDV96DRAFT_636375 [Lophiotrema nucula]|uniref:MARVEL domain-containing protein n=1 Tax=Lophiotrema nucula TaxID=690887 RepID=A0A6A5YPC2_9PLEO|nr:hypothetical protein BDV96DRAFT_636375 [Lophiotrema nucula]
MYMLKGGAVPIPRWILIFRFFQLFFAILVLGLTAYSLSVGGGGPRKIYDPRTALLLDGFATLFWLAAFAALASYERIFHNYGRFSGTVLTTEFDFCSRCRRAWKCAVAAAVFSALEFLLFLFTTLAFVYYSHCELASIPAPGLTRRETNVAGTGTTETRAGAGAETGGIEAAEAGVASSSAYGKGNYGQEMSSIPHPHAHTHNGTQHASNQGPPYPTGGETSPHPLQNHPPHEQSQGGYGGYENGSNEVYGTPSTTHP